MKSRDPDVEPRPHRLSLAYATGGFGLSTVSQAAFLVPLRARELGASLDAVGLIVGAGAVGALLMSVPSGALLDRLGPKRTYVLGAAITGLVSMLFPLVTNYWWFLLLQALLGMVRNLAWMATMSYIASIGTERQRTTLTGRFIFVSNFGQVVGPLLVGASAELVGYRWALFVPAAYALLFSFLGLFLPAISLDDGERKRQGGAGLRSARELLAVPSLRALLILVFATLWITTVYVTLLPTYLTAHGLSAGIVGAVVAVTGGVAALVAPTAGFWARRWQPTRITMAALACGSLGLVLAPHATELPWVFVIPALVGLGGGMSMPILLTLITIEAPARLRGVALGLRSMATQGAMTLAPVIAGPLVAAVGMTAGLAATGAAAAAMLAAAWMFSARRRSA